MGHSIEDYIGLVRKIASKFYPSLKHDPAISYDDLVSEGYDVFCWMLRYEKRAKIRCKFSTALGQALHSRYTDLARRSKTARRRHIRIPYDDNFHGHSSWAIEKFLDLPSEIRLIARAIIEAPAELIEQLPSRHGLTRKGLYLYMVRHLGWSEAEARNFLRNYSRNFSSKEDGP